MKKMYILFAFMLTAIAANAQTVTLKELQGKWKMIEFSDANGSASVAKGTWAVKPDAAMPKAEAEEQYKTIIAQAKDAVLVFNGNNVSQVIQGKPFSTTFKLEDRDGKTFLVAEEKNNSGTPYVFIKNGQLHFVDTEIKAELIYSSVK
jgi:hypothetical protein